MERGLTRIKDVDKKILMELDDKSLLEFCKTGKYGNQLCKDEIFWKNRFINRFGRADKNQGKSWKDFYLNMVYYLDKYGKHALYHASLKGIKNLDLIKVLLLREYNVNDGLIAASREGHKNLVEFFVSRGATDLISAYLNAKTEEIRDYLQTLGLQVLRV